MNIRSRKLDPPRQTLKSACEKGSGPAKVKMDNQRNTQPTSSIPAKYGTPEPSRVNIPHFLATWHVSIASQRRHTQSRRTPRHPSEICEPQLSIMAIGTPRQPAGTLPPWGHALLARIKVEDTSSRNDRTPARGHRIQGTLVAGFNGI